MIVPPWTLALLISVPLTVGLAQGLQSWAPRWGLVDAAEPRKAHRGAVPVGGLAVIVGGTMAMVPSLVQTPSLIWPVIGALTVGAVGIADDRRSLSPGLKLVVQVAAALLALIGGFTVTGIRLVGIEIDLGAMAAPLAVLWIVSLTNAFNLTDGLDGLACGAAVLLALAAAGMSAISNDGPTLAMAVALGGSALGFLRYNRHPARLFLGDGGSYFLGFGLALVTLRAVQPDGPGGVPLDALALFWGYPLVDTLWAIVRRARERRPITSPDRAHLHHQMLRTVGDDRKAVGMLYGVFGALTALGLLVWALGIGT